MTYVNKTVVSQSDEDQLELADKQDHDNHNSTIVVDSYSAPSFWSEKVIIEGSSGRIDINKNNLELLANVINNQLLSRLQNVQELIENSMGIIESEKSLYSERIRNLQTIYQEILIDTFSNILFQDIINDGHTLIEHIDYLGALLENAKTKYRDFIHLLNSRQVEVKLALDYGVDTDFDEARNLLYQFKNKMNELTHSTKNIVTYDIKNMFQNEIHMFDDAIVDELKVHLEIISNNRDKVKKQIFSFSEQISKVVDTFQNREDDLARAIKGNFSAEMNTEFVQKAESIQLDESPYVLNKMHIKEIHLNKTFNEFSDRSNSILIPTLVSGDFILKGIEKLLDGVIAAVIEIQNMTVYELTQSEATGMITDLDQKMKAIVNEILKPIYEIEGTIHGLQNSILQLIVNYPDVLSNFLPYVDSALFKETDYYNVHQYNITALGILEEVQLQFKEIVNQLSNEESRAMDAIYDVSEHVLKNIDTLYEQVNNITL